MSLKVLLNVASVLQSAKSRISVLRLAALLFISYSGSAVSKPVTAFPCHAAKPNLNKRLELSWGKRGANVRFWVVAPSSLAGTGAEVEREYL